MTKTIPITGLKTLLAKLQPYLKAIVSDSSVKLSDAATLNVPDQSTITISDSVDPETFNVAFNGVTVTIRARILFGMVTINGVEPLRSVTLTADTVQAIVAGVTVRGVDA